MRSRLANKLVTAVTFAIVACGSPRLPALPDYTSETILWTVAWHPDGERLSVGGNADTVFTYARATGAVASETPAPYTVTELAWHPNGTALAVVGQISQTPAVLLDAETSEARRLGGVSDEGARAVAWSPDATYLAVGDNAGYLHIFTAGGDAVERIKIDEKAVTALAWSPDGQTVATVGSAIALYDRPSRSSRSWRARDTATLLLSVAWHPDGSRFAVGDYGDPDLALAPEVSFWMAGGNYAGTIGGHRAEIRELAWSPDGRRLATASDGARVYDAEGELLAHALASHYTWGLAWHPGGEQVAVSTGDGALYVLDVGTSVEGGRATEIRESRRLR